MLFLNELMNWLLDFQAFPLNGRYYDTSHLGSRDFVPELGPP